MSDIILKAARIAAHAHRNQYRKYPDPFGQLQPFIVHPARVAAAITADATLLMESRRPSAVKRMIASAWLHDVVEDTPIDLLYLEQVFHRDVISMVRGLTKTFAFNLDGPNWRNLPRARRKSLEMAYLVEQSEFVLVIKAYDRIDNLMDLSSAPTAFVGLYASESRDLLDVLRPVIPSWLGDRLERTIERVEVKIGGGVQGEQCLAVV